MNGESQATIDLAAAAHAANQALTAADPGTPLPPPPAPHRRSGWWRLAAPAAVGVATSGLVALAQWGGLNWTASAAPWLEGANRAGTAAENGAVGVLWRRLMGSGVGLGQAISVCQFLMALALLAALALAAARLRGPRAAALAIALLLTWPTCRQLLLTVGAETPLAAGVLFALLAGLLAAARPLVAALLLAAAVGLLALAHALGLLLLPAVVLPLLVLPLRSDAEPLPGLEPRTSLWPEAVAVPHLTGILLGCGLTAAVWGHGGFHTVWLHATGEWRAPLPTPFIGGIAQWPALGPLVAIAAQVPVAVLALAVAAIVGTVRRPADPLALATGMTACVWLALCWVGLPTVGNVDAVALLAPLLVLLAAATATDVGRELWARETSSARMAGVLLAFATVLALLADLRLGAPDRRHLLAHLPGVLARTMPIRPAVLRPADLGLLYRSPVATTVFPGHPGGNALATALRPLHPALQNVSFGSAFATDQVLVGTQAGVSVEEMWARIGHQDVCTTDRQSCLVRIRVK